MKCHQCYGTGEGDNAFIPCRNCNGSGTLCDVCGEASDADIDTCYECDKEAAEGEASVNEISDEEALNEED